MSASMRILVNVSFHNTVHECKEATTASSRTSTGALLPTCMCTYKGTIDLFSTRHFSYTLKSLPKPSPTQPLTTTPSPIPYTVINGRPSLAAPGPSPVTLDDISRLSLEERYLLSDLFVLQGTFLPQTREMDPVIWEEFKKNGFATTSQFYKYEERIAKFCNEVEKRMDEQAAELPGSNRDWSDALAAEHAALANLWGNYERCKDRLASLRELLETRYENERGVFEYEAAVNYQQIGNQVKPPGYRKPQKSVRNESEQNGRPAKKVKFASVGAQPGEDFAAVPPPAPARIGAIMQEQIRTVENVDRDIASRMEQIALSKERIEKLNAEILELRWEKKVMTEGHKA
ncbi:hypothetical protein IFR05_001080 [Cadophora sp. M221]|nr:hypothetical protein IFR05_001080 [Cadophora sp. M221]